MRVGRRLAAVACLPAVRNEGTGAVRKRPGRSKALLSQHALDVAPRKHRPPTPAHRPPGLTSKRRVLSERWKSRATWVP